MPNHKSTKVCTVPDCGQKYKAIGLCRKHYALQYNRTAVKEKTARFCSRPCAGPGHAFGRQVLTDPLSHDVLAELEQICTLDENGCWLWNGAVDSHGYSQYTLHRGKGDRVILRVHRVALAAYLGTDLGKFMVHHACSNSICCNPAHLQAVSYFDNQAEMLERRWYVARIAELEAQLAALQG